MKCRSKPVVQSVQHTGGRPGRIIFFGDNLGDKRVLLDDGRNDSVSAVSDCAMERLPTLIVLPVDHCL